MKKIIEIIIFLSATLLLASCGGGGVGGSAPAPVTAPVAPAIVSTVSSDSQVTIVWNVADATSYNVYMATASGVNMSNYARKSS